MCKYMPSTNANWVLIVNKTLFTNNNTNKDGITGFGRHIFTIVKFHRHIRSAFKWG